MELTSKTEDIKDFIPRYKEEIWIAKDICCSSTDNHSKWHRFWAKVLLGWIIKDIK